MPHKFNDARRDKFEKAGYRVTNASEYNESLRRRGDLTVWVADDVAKDWSSPRRKTRGGHGRLAWQVSSGYNQRSRGEAQIGRWKGVIGPKLKARNFENQKREVKVAVTVLNKTAKLGRPEIEAII
jgi:hypothetical protein